MLNKMVTVLEIIFAVLLIISLLDVESQIMLPWQERSLLCQMFATCNYPEKVFGKRFSAIMANFVLRFSHFRCHGNRGRSDVNANDTSKLLDLENPVFGQHLWLYFLY